MEKLETIKLNEIEYVRKDQIRKSEFKNSENLPYCILRGYRSGVVCGYANHISGEVVEVHNARQMYRWFGTFVLVDLAEKGITKPDKCRFSIAASNKVTITDCCAILICTETSAKTLINQKAETNE